MRARDFVACLDDKTLPISSWNDKVVLRLNSAGNKYIFIQLQLLNFNFKFKSGA